MKFVTVSELRLRATEIVREIEETKGKIIVTKKGKPVVLMQLINEDDFSLNKTEGNKKRT